MSRFAVSLAIVLVAAAVASAQPARAPRLGPNAALAPTLAHCLPGATFAGCTTALDAAHVARVAGAMDGATRRTVPLRAPWLALDVVASSATGAIAELRFEGTQRPGAPRRRLLDFFTTALRDRTLGDSPLGVGCSGIGPAWFESEAARAAHTPRVQLTVDHLGSLPAFGLAADRAFLRAPHDADQRVHLCALADAPGAGDPFVAALASYLASPSF